MCTSLPKQTLNFGMKFDRCCEIVMWNCTVIILVFFCFENWIKASYPGIQILCSSTIYFCTLKIALKIALKQQRAHCHKKHTGIKFVWHVLSVSLFVQHVMALLCPQTSHDSLRLLFAITDHTNVLQHSRDSMWTPDEFNTRMSGHNIT